MPYCTIEEAWNESLNPELREFQDNKKKEYKQINYNNSVIYDQDGKSVTNDKKCVKKKKVLNLSRTYNRLPEHSGPTSRLPNSNDPNNYYNSLENNDLPINKYNNSKRMKKKILTNKNIKNKNKKKSKNNNDKIKENFSEISNVRINSKKKKRETPENSKDDEDDEDNNYENEIRKLKIENEKLKNIINELKNSNNVSNTKDSFLDVLIYIVTGIIIILMMENITKLVRRF